MTMIKGGNIEEKDYYRYARDVAEGKIRACLFVRQACLRFLSDLKREDIEFRVKRADHGIRFISMLRHFEGEMAGKPFILEPFQSFIVANLLGWYRSGGSRRYTSAYIEMARKGGKTALIAALAMYYFLADGEAGAEIDIAANDFKQATICFRFLREYCHQADPKGKFLKVRRADIEREETSSKVFVFSADASKKDGFNASVGIIDEYHSARNTALRDVISSSMVMRKNPMLLTITSAGFDKTLPCYAYRTMCAEILAGLKEDDSLFCIMFSLDEGDDWKDPGVWKKSNPNLGVTVSEERLMEQVRRAMNNPGEEVGVRTKNFGEWLSSSTVWIPEQYIREATGKVAIEDFSGCEAWGGADLASVGDMTALSLMLVRPEDPKLYFKTIYYLPETAMRESPNRDKYGLWERMGSLKITPGNVTDYQWITNDLMEITQDLRLECLFYDPYNSTSWVTQCTELGIEMEAYTQNLGNFNRPTREFERLVRSGRVVIDDNPITRWMFANVALKTDHNGNAKPIKGAGAEKKIDGIIAMLEALGGYLTAAKYDYEIRVI